MDKKVKEPFVGARIFNLLTGLVILGLILVVLHKDTGTEIFEILIFALAALINFVSATISFSKQRKIQGNICAAISGLFLIFGILLTVAYYI